MRPDPTGTLDCFLSYVLKDRPPGKFWREGGLLLALSSASPCFVLKPITRQACCKAGDIGLEDGSPSCVRGGGPQINNPESLQEGLGLGMTLKPSLWETPATPRLTVL